MPSRAGDSTGAEAALQAVEVDLAARREAGLTDSRIPLAESIVAALRNNAGSAADAMRRAIDAGLRERGVFHEPAFSAIHAVPGFQAVRQRLDSILADERTKTLELICRNNPVPDAWQPLSDTCGAIARQSRAQ